MPYRIWTFSHDSPISLAIVDEIPGAYKDIEEVMRAQNDLVEIVAELKQVICVKG